MVAVSKVLRLRGLDLDVKLNCLADIGKRFGAADRAFVRSLSV
jgi:hypothetical protein